MCSWINNKVVCSGFTLLFFVAASACGNATPPPLTSISLQLNRPHGAAFAGFYAAVENGYSAEEGLNITFLEGGPSIDEIALVVDGTAQLGVIAGDVLLLGRDEGKHVRAVATILRHEPFVFFSLADSGITRPEDFIGKKILVSPNTIPRLHAMLGRVGIAPDQVIEVSTGDFTALYTGEIDVAGGALNSTILQVQRDGYKVNLIYLDNYGLHFYSDTLFATDEFIAANPDMLTRFLRASFRRWTYVVENPETVAAMVLKYDPNADSSFETAKMIATLPFVNTGEDYIGWMRPEIWEEMTSSLRDQGFLTSPLDATDVYTLKFIQQIYGGN